MNITIPGNVRLSFDVDSVEVDASSFSLENGQDTFTVSYSWQASSPDGLAAARLQGTVQVPREEIAADSGKTFEKATIQDIRQAIRKAVVAHVKTVTKRGA